MLRFVALVTALVVTPAVADTPKKEPTLPPPPLPKVGDDVRAQRPDVAPWPKLDWLYEAPNPRDSAGKVIVHWFCSPKVQACSDDLARIVTLKENGNAYVIAYINGTKSEAQKLDPIRGSEGVGAGTVAYGKGVAALMKGFGIAPGPASFVEDVEGKVGFVATTSGPDLLDARDQNVAALIAATKAFTSTADNPKGVKPGDKFQLVLAIKLASWLHYDSKSPNEFKLTAPPDIKCDATTLKTEQLTFDAQTLTATVNCTAPKGIYEARGEIRFSYATATGATGIGNESAKWKFEVK
jgi:hypothetical protein